MVKQISLHAAGNAERGAYGSKYSDNHLQDSFPNFLFHFFSFLFLMVQHLERDWAGVHPCRFPLRFLVVNFPFAVLNEWQCSLSSNTVQRYKKNRQNAIVVLNHVHPYPGSRASLSRIPCIPLSSPSSWRCTANCIPTYRLLRRDVAGGASPRSFGGIGRTVTSCVG